MAVYTEISASELSDFLEKYAIGSALSFKGIAEGVENSNYLLITDQGQFILTLYEKRVQPKDLPYFIGLMEHLSAHGLKCPVPIKDRNGNALSTLAGRPAAIVSFLDGICLTTPQAKHCNELGNSLAALHLAGADYPATRPNGLGLTAWRPLYEKCGSDTEQVQRGLSQIITEELEALETAWPEDLPSGVIHADLFPDNVFFINDEISGLIDFYFACNDSFCFDLGVCLNAWCFEADGAFNTTKAAALLSGYTARRTLTDDELHALPILCRGTALRFLLTRLYDWLNQVDGALVKPKDPLDYVHRLRFHQRATSPRSYGLV